MTPAQHVVAVLRQCLSSEKAHPERFGLQLFEKRTSQLHMPLWRKQIVEWLNEASDAGGVVIFGFSWAGGPFNTHGYVTRCHVAWVTLCFDCVLLAYKVDSYRIARNYEIRLLELTR